MEKNRLPHKIYIFENYRLDSEQKLLFSDGHIVPLGQKAYECLLLLVENAGEVVLKQTFFDKIWNDSFVEDGVLAVNISHLRKIFGDTKDKKYIETLPRRGYRFAIEVETENSSYRGQKELPSVVTETEKIPSENDSASISSESIDNTTHKDKKEIIKDFEVEKENPTVKSSTSLFIISGILFVILIVVIYLLYRN